MKKFLISLVALNLMQPQIFASQSDKILEAVDVVESERRDRKLFCKRACKEHN